MSSGQRSILWLIVGLLVVTAAAFSVGDKGIAEGTQGSYLGRSVTNAPSVPANARDTLDNRANSYQRY
jgi:hypothetical protein